MRHLDEYREAAMVRRWAGAVAGIATRPWTLMEICGGQTHAILHYGLDALLPSSVRFLHGPGCPVCVTPSALIDQAGDLARQPGVTLCSFGDMLRVPGRRGDLLAVKAAGGDVRTVYSPLDAVALAQAHPDRQVVFFAIGFETTAPATALAVMQARDAGLANFTLLVAHVRVVPAVEAILATPGHAIHGLLAPGHVCAVTGARVYEPLSKRFDVPVVVAGFEPVDILEAVFLCVRQLEAGRAEVENAYARAARTGGNPAAQAVMNAVFEPATRPWRGLGAVPDGALALRPAWAAFDAAARFGLPPPDDAPSDRGCLSDAVLRGVKTPDECPALGAACTPEHPLGAPMVSSEGACAAYYLYKCNDER